jgi:putative transposase
MPTNLPPITYGTFYHIYNRGNNREDIFIQEQIYPYFLRLWWTHIPPIAETWAYCLLRNHFHMVVYIKNREDLTGLKPPSQYFSNFFNAYARGVNLSTQRSGALFQRPFKRIPVDSTSYLMRLIVYVHQNPQKHHFCDDFRDWKYSSYHELTGQIATRLHRDKIIQLFGSREDFVRTHEEIQPLEDFEDED